MWATGTQLTKIKQETTITVRKNVQIYDRKSQTWKDRREKKYKLKIQSSKKYTQEPEF